MADKKISEETLLTKDGTERIPVIQSDGSGGWVNGALAVVDLDKNLENSDLLLPEDRKVDLGTFKLFFINGKFIVKSFDFMPDTSDDSSIFDIVTIGQGVRLFPPMTTADRDGLSPTNRVMVHNTDIGYPEIFVNEIYKWQSIGYGEIRLTIDFSVTPLNSGNSWTIEIPSIIPSGKVIHKMVAVGTGVQDPGGGEDYSFGITSDSTYFTAGVATGLNGSSGSISTGNSNRTVSANENIIVSYLGATGTINTGIIELLISHT